ncbi:uncharacterized protein B0I36DRAFT_356169 [Microdochium trichocladiopsis]|uniref:Uncharacterized protein n=1 Tax=Microdochium trichocladiopsis TaxID=1682393 RepID=A0A9P8XQQ9_9PEZI|nr:uncharacterized protein B0I36DRAFT_356169 [Microdochium trichocladiopsis]KAH7012071.1 hypothetical protein B0I36DRAFT_356169 [Microdochium trichocladiopsis]
MHTAEKSSAHGRPVASRHAQATQSDAVTSLPYLNMHNAHSDNCNISWPRGLGTSKGRQHGDYRSPKATPRSGHKSTLLGALRGADQLDELICPHRPKPRPYGALAGVALSRDKSMRVSHRKPADPDCRPQHNTTFGLLPAAYPLVEPCDSMANGPHSWWTTPPAWSS